MTFINEESEGLYTIMSPNYRMVHVEKKKVKGINYYYLVKKVWDSKKKNSVKAWQMYLGTGKRIAKGLSPKPKKAEAKLFGDVFSVYDTMVELGIDKIVNNLPLSKSEAELLQLSVINRATNATSKNKMSSWFKKTALFKKFSLSPRELTSLDYTRLMKKVSDDDVIKAVDVLLENLQGKGIDTSDVILDNTNYTTRLQKNKKLALPCLGKSKNGKTGCLQINIHMIVSRDGKIPLYYRPYQGNINDPTFFEANREKLLELGERFKTNGQKVTLSIDAGHNSEDNIKAVDKKYDFIGTLRPSMCKDLIEKPSSKFTEIINLHGGETIKIYSEKRKVYEKEYTLAVSQFSATQRKSIHTLEDNISQAIKRIKLFEQDLNATFKAEEKGLKKRKTKFHDLNKIESHVNNIIKNKKHVKEILTKTVTLKNNRVLIKINVNQQVKEKIEDRLGRAIRFTNRNDLSPSEIIEYYSGQYMIEHQFKDLKNPHLTSIMPMYHRIDETIKIFIFTNYLALVILTFMERKLRKKLKIFITKETMLEELNEMKEIILYFDKKATSIITESVDKNTQKKLYNTFNLDQYYKLPL